MCALLSQKKISKLFALSTLLVSFMSSAYTINISVKGSTVTYDNALTFYGDSKVTSDWDVVEALTPATEWQPGILDVTGSTFQVSGGGVSVEVPIKVLGAQFGMKSTPTGQGGAIYTGGAGSCTLSTDGSTVSFYNPTLPTTIGNAIGSCSAANSILISENQPFYFVRPIFQIDEDALLTALKTATDGVTINSGTVFVGSVPTSLRYFFKYGTVTTVRNLAAKNLTVRITYTKDELLDVELTPFKEIPPVYDESTNTASGETEFDVKLHGTVSSGIKMTFMKRDYIMTHKGLFSEAVEDPTAPGGYVLTEDGYTNTSKGIKYYVKCDNLCNVNDMVSGYIVKDGALALNQSQMVVRVNAQGSTGDPNMAYKLQVGYENLPATDVISGLYMDTFTIMFELDY